MKIKDLVELPENEFCSIRDTARAIIWAKGYNFAIQRIANIELNIEAYMDFDEEVNQDGTLTRNLVPKWRIIKKEATNA